MAEAALEAGSMTLSEFLDTLPKKPCEQIPENRYFCSVCERLNSGVAARCNYSKVESGSTMFSERAEHEPVQFIQMPDGEKSPYQLKESSDIKDQKPGEGVGISAVHGVKPMLGPRADQDKRVEFKVVAPLQADGDYPLLELVQPKEKQVKPLEMELLEDVAIEFEVSDEEPVEVEAIEVEALSDDDEIEIGETDLSNNDEVSEAMVVEVIETDEIDEDELENIDIDTDTPEQPVQNNLPQFKPIDTSTKPESLGVGLTPKKMQTDQLRKPLKMAKKPKKIKKKGIKKFTKIKKEPTHRVKPQFKPQPQTQVGTQSIIPVRQPRSNITGDQPKAQQPQPTRAPHTQPRPTYTPTPTQSPVPASSREPLIDKAGLTNFRPIAKTPPKKLKKVRKAT